MTPLALLIVAFAFLYTISTVGGMIALATGTDKPVTRVSVNAILFIDALLLTLAYFANNL